MDSFAGGRWTCIDCLALYTEMSEFSVEINRTRSESLTAPAMLRRDFEDHALAVCSVRRSCSIQITGGVEYQPAIRSAAIHPAGEVM